MKKYIAIALVIVLCLSLTACGASVDGYYEIPNGEWGIKFSKSLFGENTFVQYVDGEPLEQDGYTRTWELDGDVLSLHINGGSANGGSTGYRKVYGDYLVNISGKDADPPQWDRIAPEGDRFDYRIDDYEFYQDGTYKYGGWYYTDTGVYYRVNNTIYIEGVYDDEYEAAYYIYDGDHIISTNYVLVKDSLLRKIEIWFVSFALDF